MPPCAELVFRNHRVRFGEKGILTRRPWSTRRLSLPCLSTNLHQILWYVNLFHNKNSFQKIADSRLHLCVTTCWRYHQSIENYSANCVNCIKKSKLCSYLYWSFEQNRPSVWICQKLWRSFKNYHNSISFF